MFVLAKVRNVVLSFMPVFVVFCLFPGFLTSQVIEKGNLVGYVFDRDGKTPIPGAVAKLRNITSGTIYESLPSDSSGVFNIEGLNKGIYTFGITTSLGDFNSNDLVGILTNETTKVTISLNPYESGVQSAVQEVLRDQAQPVNQGESRIGRIVYYNPDAKEASVFIERGILQTEDSIRIRGVQTNFGQDAGPLRIGDKPVRRALVGETAWMKVKGAVQTGDSVYVVCQKGIVPFFLTPCGIAWVVAGTGAIMAGIITITEKSPVSPFAPIK
jgi:hypothetical protein